MNYPQVIETLKRLGVTNIETPKIRTRTGEIPDGVSFYWPSLMLREKVGEIRLALPDCKVYFSPNTSKIYIEER